MDNKKTRRRQLIVNGPVQARIMLSAALVPFAILVVNAIVVMVFCRTLSQEAVVAGVELPSATPLILASGAFLLVSAGFIATYVLQLSHRIAGPMRGISNTLEAVRSGDAARRCALRKRDLLAPLSVDVNGFLDWVQHERDQTGAGLTESAAESVEDVPGLELDCEQTAKQTESHG